ncbi:MAG: hypothetical protein IPN15_18010 [Saprospiraceae bacterium]|nr:hypothetical protein [Candidatus Vicinibacter affinis]
MINPWMGRGYFVGGRSRRRATGSRMVLRDPLYSQHIVGGNSCYSWYSAATFESSQSRP